jgi:hypothetical protein
MTCRRSSSSSSSTPSTLKSHTHTRTAPVFFARLSRQQFVGLSHTEVGKQFSRLASAIHRERSKRSCLSHEEIKKNKNSAHAGNHGFVYVCVCRRSYLDKKVALQHTHIVVTFLVVTCIFLVSRKGVRDMSKSGGIDKWPTLSLFYIVK